MNGWPNFRIVSGITFLKITVGDMVTWATGQCLYITTFSSLQDGPQRDLLPGVHILVHMPPTLCQGWSMWSTAYGQKQRFVVSEIGL